MSKRKRPILIIVIVLVIGFLGGTAAIYSFVFNKEDIEDKKQDILLNNGNKEINEKETPNNEENKIEENKKDKKEIKQEVEKKKEDSKPKVTENIKDNNKSNKKNSWYFMAKGNGQAPTPPEESESYLKANNGVYLGDTSKKVIYLTFDEGYENGYTSKILDILKSNNVKAAFFVTKPYIKDNKELIKRMVNEGHLVGNHSVTHSSMDEIVTKGIDAFRKEIKDVEEEYKSLIGKDMIKVFRPPMGNYSEKSLSYTKALGYKSVFWSFAYGDYDVNKQPDKTYAKNHILKSTHNGAIYLLHAISKTNLDILDEVIKEWKSMGYEFRSLEEL
ncbi:delta-lactam-biosynthetic de-N-acetylase [Clostridium sp.]|uniref:delta-lactam-biosynthetic de-N-acetylase n=1 Tax=Clostridium sp. TaxID=1506 RepID=UPI003463E6DA